MDNDDQKHVQSDSLSTVCNTTAFPNPNGICMVSEYCQVIYRFVFRTILNQSLAGLECSFIDEIKIIAMKGRIPHVRLMNLYFPVLCIDHLRNRIERDSNAG